MATATMSHPQSSKQRSTLTNRPPLPGLETNDLSLYKTQGGSQIIQNFHTGTPVGFSAFYQTLASHAVKLGRAHWKPVGVSTAP